MRVLVTGANGFVGRHLVPALRSHGHEVVSLHGRSEGGVDITDASAVAAAFQSASPNAVVHLAGWSSVGTSFECPRACFEANTLGTVNVCDAMRTHCPGARLLFISSAEVYGPLDESRGRKETDPPLPVSPYAASKLSAELCAAQYRDCFGIDMVVARPFNHVGPGQSPRFVVPSFVQKLEAVRRGERDPVVEMGNLSAVRDFSHVADVVDAYILLLEHGEGGETYNVCSETARSIERALQEILQCSGVRAEIRSKAGKPRPTDLAHLVGDGSKLRRLGFAPTRNPFEGLFPKPPLQL